MTTDSTSGKIYLFESYRLDADSGDLTRNGYRVRLQDQPTRLLLLLVERPGEIVTREEIQTHLWPGNTYVEFDQSLNVAIRRLREALGETASSQKSQRYIETIPKRGYRFVAAVEVLEPPPSEEEHPTVVEAVEPQSEPATHFYLLERKRAQRVLAGVAAVLMVVVLAGYFVWRWHRAASHLNPDDLVVFAGIHNTTGNGDFDEALNSALRIKMEESPFLNLLSDHAVRDALELAGRKPAERLSDEEFSFACHALHARAILSGTIAANAGGYRLELAAHSCQEGNTLALKRADAATAAEVLNILGQLSDALRQDLGEPEITLHSFNTPIEQATTSSLTALRAFSQGERFRQQGDDRQAIMSYEMAVDLDPKFALAYARLGILYSNSAAFDKGDAYYKQAFDLREHTTERERLYITTHYYAGSLGDMERAVTVYEIWHQQYPQDLIPPNNLGEIYDNLGQPTRAYAMAQVARQINPNHVYPMGVLAEDAVNLGHFQQAIDLMSEAQQKKLDDDVFLRIQVLSAALMANDRQEVDRQLAWIHGKEREAEFINLVGRHQLYEGKPGDAVRLIHQAQESAAKNDYKELAGVAGIELAQFEADLGQNEDSRADAQRAVQYAPEELNVLSAASLVWANFGDEKKALELIHKVTTAKPEDTSYNKMFLPLVNGLLALRHNHAEQALVEFEKVKPYDLSSILDLAPIYYRAEALNAAGRYQEAAAEYQRVLDNKSLARTTPYVPLSHLGRARAYLKLGDHQQALAAYKLFAANWGDHTATLYRQAEKEFSELN